MHKFCYISTSRASMDEVLLKPDLNLLTFIVLNADYVFTNHLISMEILQTVAVSIASFERLFKKLILTYL